ncbi:hypothetical protein J6590_077583 [Homalodisca vitripennis]|nr:hypothetical protein J6590_077580 [Homalodisca vitripennis]KAG8285573.1 hypothetical protein J6590_077583 [Homalodisca vitripennis]
MPYREVPDADTVTASVIVVADQYGGCASRQYGGLILISQWSQARHNLTPCCAVRLRAVICGARFVRVLLLPAEEFGALIIGSSAVGLRPKTLRGLLLLWFKNTTTTT